MKDFNCKLDVPYPDIAVEAPNMRYARILNQLMAGRYSELTAIAQYTYQNIIAEQKDYELSESLNCIAIVEMDHYRILGQLIRLLGGDPRLRANLGARPNVWWSGEYPNYTNSIDQIIDENIMSEKKAISDYKNAMTYICDHMINAVIERIILDEEHHLEIFTAFKAT